MAKGIDFGLSIDFESDAVAAYAKLAGPAIVLGANSPARLPRVIWRLVNTSNGARPRSRPRRPGLSGRAEVFNNAGERDLRIVEGAD